VPQLETVDAVLVRRCQDGDYAAFDEIVARYKDGVYNYIWRMISDRDDVDDLAQEVFVRAFGSIKKFRQESNLRTWLYRIASNICIDKYRRSGPEKALKVPLEREMGDDSWEPIELPDSSFDPSRMFDQTELRKEIDNALLRLPEKLRSVIVLYDIEGMAYDEIAETLDCPLGTVKSRLFKARMQLRGMLKPYVEA
jgi:RNA polymerase sigma-70 factor (ECF subfamily)